MNGKAARKIKQKVRRDVKECFSDFAETLNKAPFLIRVKVCWKILVKKL